MESPALPTRLLDGSQVLIRPIEPGDGERLREIWAGMSELSRRRRFLTPTSAASDEDLRYLVDVDHRRHEALLALDGDGTGIGVARYVRTPGEREAAEVAVVVADAWHRRGLGTLLLDGLTERARDNGIERYTAIVSEDNDIVLRALGRVGATQTATNEGEIEFVFDVPAEGIGERLADALRAAAEAPRDFIALVLRRVGVWERD